MGAFNADFTVTITFFNLKTDPCWILPDLKKEIPAWWKKRYKSTEIYNVESGKLLSPPCPSQRPPPTKPLLMMVYLNVLHYDLLWQFQQQQGEGKKNYIKTKLENSIPPPSLVSLSKVSVTRVNCEPRMLNGKFQKYTEVFSPGPLWYGDETSHPLLCPRQDVSHHFAWHIYLVLYTMPSREHRRSIIYIQDSVLSDVGLPATAHRVAESRTLKWLGTKCPVCILEHIPCRRGRTVPSAGCACLLQADGWLVFHFLVFICIFYNKYVTWVVFEVLKKVNSFQKSVKFILCMRLLWFVCELTEDNWPAQFSWGLSTWSYWASWDFCFFIPFVFISSSFAPSHPPSPPPPSF